MAYKQKNEQKRDRKLLKVRLMSNHLTCSDIAFTDPLTVPDHLWNYGHHYNNLLHVIGMFIYYRKVGMGRKVGGLQKFLKVGRGVYEKNCTS